MSDKYSTAACPDCGGPVASQDCPDCMGVGIAPWSLEGERDVDCRTCDGDGWIVICPKCDLEWLRART